MRIRVTGGSGLIVAALSAWASVATAAPLTLTLDQAVELAEKNATVVAKAGLNKDVTGAQLLQAYAQYLPNLAAIAGASYNTGHVYSTQGPPTRISGNDYGGNVTVSSAINLFNGFADQAGLKAALSRNDAAEMTLGRAREQIAIDVTQSFLQVVLDQDLVQIANANLAVSKQRQELLEEQARIGAKDLATLYRQRAQTATDQSAFISTQNKLHNDAILLARKVKLDLSQELAVQRPNLDVAPTPLVKEAPEALVRRAIDARKDLKAANGNAKAADENVTVARGGYYPRLDFGVQAASTSRTLLTHDVNGVSVVPASQEPELPQLKDHWLYTAGVTLSWNVFDRRLVFTQVERASADAKAAAIDRDDLRLQVEGEVRQAYGDYQSAVERFDARKSGLTAAKQAFDAVQGRYGVGSASFIDLTTAQTVLAQAQSDQAQSIIDVFLQSRLIEYYVGGAH